MLILVATSVLISCGGGGGDSSFDTSNAVMALPTLENGEKVEEVSAVNQQDQYSLNAVANENNPNIILTMVTLVKGLKQSLNTDLYALNQVINQSCDYGGSFFVKTNQEYGEDMTLTVDYSQCGLFDGIVANGRARMLLTNFTEPDDDYTNYDITYLSDFTIVADGITMTILDGATAEQINLRFDYSGAVEMDMKITANSIVNGVTNGMEDVNLRMSMDYNQTMYYKSGRFYIDNLTAYADYDSSWDMSLTPFIFDGNSGELLSGEARFNLANGGKARIVGTGGEPMTYVDADGDGDFELSES